MVGRPHRSVRLRRVLRLTKRIQTTMASGGVRAGRASPTQSPVASTPTVPRSGAALTIYTGRSGNAAPEPQTPKALTTPSVLPATLSALRRSAPRMQNRLICARSRQ